MIIMFKRSKEKLEMEDIIDFENNFNIKLPEDLKKILLKYNGGVLEGNTMEDKFIFINGIKSTYSFSILYSIKYGTNTMEEAIDIYQITEEHIPREYLPFAEDQGGNPYTISTNEDDYGKIYIWFMDVGEPERVFVANSLEEFFTGKSE